MFFDVPLRYHLHQASVSDGNMDLAHLWGSTLTAFYPDKSVTFVGNYDTQPNQSLVSAVALWFKAAVYTLIPFNEVGAPCVFWGDLLSSPKSDNLPAVYELPVLMSVRARAVVGPQYNAFDHPGVVGSAREGKDEIPDSGCAAILFDRVTVEKTLYVGTHRADQAWECIIGGHPSVLVVDGGTLTGVVSDGGLSIYVLCSNAWSIGAAPWAVTV